MCTYMYVYMKNNGTAKSKYMWETNDTAAPMEYTSLSLSTQSLAAVRRRSIINKVISYPRRHKKMFTNCVALTILSQAFFFVSCFHAGSGVTVLDGIPFFLYGLQCWKLNFYCLPQDQLDRQNGFYKITFFSLRFSLYFSYTICRLINKFQSL